MGANRKRKGRKRAAGSRAPILTEARPNARWSVDFVHGQLSNGRRFRILNVIDDVAKDMPGGDRPHLDLGAALASLAPSSPGAAGRT